MPKYTKNQADYSRGEVNSHCGKVFIEDKSYCKHFRGQKVALAKGTCERVEGEIDPIFWCSEFEKVQ